MKPITTKVSPTGEISIGGISTKTLAETYGTPLYVIDYATLEANANAYLKPLQTLYPNSLVTYASKACLVKGLIAPLAALGMGFDVVSAGEIITAIKGGADTNKMVFHGNNKSKEELELAITHNIRIIIDNETEIKLLSAASTKLNKKARVLVRIKPEIEAHTHEYIKTGHIDSKFGIDKNHILEAIRTLNNDSNIDFLGIHSHIGSQIFDIEPFVDLAKIMVGHMKRIKDELGIEIKELNLGGGIGIQYTTADNAPKIALVLEAMIKSLKESLTEHHLNEPLLMVEPGRSTIATAGVTLYEIGTVKTTPGLNYVFIDGGMADNPRFIMYKSLYTFELANRANEPATKPYTIAGKFCESGDKIGENVMLPDTNEGDHLIVYGTGAYNYAMASNYNRFCKPAMIMVKDGAVIELLKRETIEDLLKNDV
ncbi:MAG: diaminopimelate decarboxylase [bacterium]|nr:diaminopimelate decarboxylase [bacterium]